MQVFYSTPYRSGDIGGGINEFMELLPADAWACIRDADTLFLTPTQQEVVQRIARTNPPFELIGCMTNRIRAPWQLHDGKISNNDRISHHMRIAQERETRHDTRLIDAPIPTAGFFMLFRVRTWRQTPFERHTAFFDKRFSKAVVQAGGRIGVAPGLYLWHTYRLGKANPTEAVDHLRGML